MRQVVFSVPQKSFPADAGDRVRISLTGIEGVDVIEAYVNTILYGCGASDVVDLLYDDTTLPENQKQLSKCHLLGFQEICDCCAARPCINVFAPTEVVANTTRHVMTLPGPFRLDAVKFYSPNPIPTVIGEFIVDGFGENVVDQNENTLIT